VFPLQQPAGRYGGEQGQVARVKCARSPLLQPRIMSRQTVHCHLSLEALRLATGRPAYRVVFEFWLKIFGVAFGLGVVSGVVMAFEFGTNWSELSRMSGPVQGPLLSYETFTAFFLEASFFGILLFGRSRVPPFSCSECTGDSGARTLQIATSARGSLLPPRRGWAARRSGRRPCAARHAWAGPCG
jgi:hypothetical protein